MAARAIVGDASVIERGAGKRGGVFVADVAIAAGHGGGMIL